MKMFLTAMIIDEHTLNYSFQSDSSFLLRNSMMININVPAAKTLKFSFLHAVYIESSNCSVHLTLCDTLLKFSAIMYYF